MEFNERIDVNASNWLLSQLSDNFLKQIFLEGETDERFRLTPVKKILQKYNKSQGKEKVKYYKKRRIWIIKGLRRWNSIASNYFSWSYL